MEFISVLTFATFVLLQFQVYGKYQFVKGADSVAIGRGIVKECVQNAIDAVTDGFVILPHTPAYRYYLASRPTKQSLEIAKNSAAVMISSQLLLQAQLMKAARSAGSFGNVPMTTLAMELGKMNLNGSAMEACIMDRYTTCRYNRRYRNINGTCNNLGNLSLGRSATAYQRFIFPDYKDGIYAEGNGKLITRRWPNPRIISKILSRHENEEEERHTLALMVWGEFVANDLSQTVTTMLSGKVLNCCNENNNVQQEEWINSTNNPCFCASIPIVDNDFFYHFKGITCMNYIRSSLAPSSNCTFGPAQQINQASHFLDGSTIYGSSYEESLQLRTFEGGKLKVNKKNNREYLPDAKGEGADECEGTCYMSGDSRVNDHPQLTAMHTIWVREHNRVSERLRTLRPTWTDEKLYQEARRIVIAEIQHITYHEWLPNIVAYDVVTLINHQPYDSNINPETSNEAATAALRFVYYSHAAGNKVRFLFVLVNEEREVTDTLRLYKNFFNPRIIESTDKLNSILRGLATQASSKLDLNYVSDLINRYYANKDGVGLDIFSMDIHRGRDHGIASYNEYRQWCGVFRAETFHDFSFEIPPEIIIDLKERLYGHPEEIDLIVGLLAEKRSGKSLVGPTLECLLINQFETTRKGDRYFYDNPRQEYPFTAEQLKEIGTVRLAKIFCDNGNGIKKIQPDVFKKPSPGNELTLCEEIHSPKIVTADCLQ